MITNAYTRTAPLSSVIADSARQIIDRLLTRQATIADVDYNRRHEPHLADSLSPAIAKIDSSPDLVSILIEYPTTIRFLDLKKTGLGYKKRYYTPIYNRPLYGHIYGKGYSLSNLVNVAINNEFQKYTQSLKILETPIEL